MNKPNLLIQNVLKSCIGILLSILIFFSAGLDIPKLDSQADTYFSESITKAGVSYATCRIINASVSIVQQSTLQLEPAGVGVSLAVGQILDPINDMTERLSDVLVMAITSLGVQELAYELSILLAPQIFAFFLLIMSILVWFQNDRTNHIQKTTMGVLLFVGIARFCLPISSVANEYIQTNFFDDKITQANNELALGIADLEKLKDISSVQEKNGFLGSIKGNAQLIKEKSVQLKNAIAVTVKNSANIINNLLELTFLYVGIFLIQVVILPIFIFWFLLRIVNSIFYTNISMTTIRSSEEQ